MIKEGSNIERGISGKQLCFKTLNIFSKSQRATAFNTSDRKWAPQQSQTTSMVQAMPSPPTAIKNHQQAHIPPEKPKPRHAKTLHNLHSPATTRCPAQFRAKQFPAFKGLPVPIKRTLLCLIKLATTARCTFKSRPYTSNTLLFHVTLTRGRVTPAGLKSV